MYSNGNATDIYILDDETIPQPGYMSMIYIPGDQVYSNGTAAAIRMITGDSVGLEEDISGVTFSSITFLNKFSFALGSIFVFGILGLLDFQTNTEINFSSKIFLFFSYAFLPIILKVFCYFMLKKFESSKDDLLEIQKKL